MPITVLGLLSFSFVAYKYINVVIEKELSNSMLMSVGKSAESINRWLVTLMIEPEIMASTPAAKRINQDFSALDRQNINRHKVLYEKYPDIFQDIYAANSKGEYHTVQQSGDEFSIFVGDIANRPYFSSIMAGNPTQITPPLISRTTGIPTIFMVSPILDDQDHPQGLIGAGISLKYIHKIARGLKAGDTGYGFIIAKDGAYIYHPDPEMVLQEKITELDDPSEQELGRLMLSGGSGMYRYTQGGRGMVAFYQPIDVTGWSVATVLPAAELFAPAIKMMRLLAGITVILVLSIGTATLLAMQRLTRPLQTLAARTQEIAAGNLEGTALDVKSKDEIGILSQSFNIMADNLKQSLSGLKKSEDNYRGIFENSIDGILQITMGGEILNANPAMARMLGYSSAEELITTFAENGQELYADPEDYRQIVSRLLESGSVHDHEVQFVQSDQSTIWVAISAFLVRDSSGEPLRSEALVTDISDRKHAEQEREKLFEQLVQAQKLEAVGQLAGGVAHDFNNMLSVILGQTQLALLKTRPADPFHKSFLEIQNAAEHSANLTRQLLAFARKQAVAPQLIDLNQTINNTLNLLRRLLPEDIELTLRAGEEIWPVFIDPDQVGQILTNLCVNARDAIYGLGRIVIETQNTSFDSAYCAQHLPDCLPGEYVCLSVSDNGSGMNKRTQEHIFEPFFTTKGIAQGTGLGLSTVYGIVKQNKAFINLYSEAGQGTIFKIYLPRHQVSSQSAPLQPAERSVTLGVDTVLLVEDEPWLLDVSKEILEELGCRVLAAGSPNEAIEIAADQSCEIDLLITDVVMPEMNGRDLAALIGNLRPEIRCLFMSGYTADIIADKGVLESGVNFIQKPFTIHALAASIEQVMHRKAV